MPRRFLLLAGDINWHIGDRAIRAALVEHIRADDPHAVLYSFSYLAGGRGGGMAAETPIHSLSALLGNVRRLRRLDAIVWGGGQILQDDSSMVKTLYWAVVLSALRRLSGRPIVGCGVGLGPLRTAWGRRFGWLALRNVRQLIVRDRRSADLAAALGYPREDLAIAPDLAVGLRPEDGDAARRYLEETEGVPHADDELRIGVVFRRWFHVTGGFLPDHWRRRGAPDRGQGSAKFEQLRRNLADALNGLARHERMRFLFFPLHTAPWEGDDSESADLARSLSAPSHVLSLQCPPGMVKALMGQCDLCVSLRLHGAALAMGMDIPTLGIACAEKTSEFFRDLGEDERLVAVEEAAGEKGADLLSRRMTDLARNRVALAASLRRKWAPYVAGCDVYAAALRRLPALAPAGPQGKAG